MCFTQNIITAAEDGRWKQKVNLNGELESRIHKFYGDLFNFQV